MIRLATADDLEEILRLLDAAFAPSQYESKLVSLVMISGEPGLAWVSLREEKIVGYVLFTQAYRETERIGHHLAPVAVLPEWQGKGIGAELIREALAKAPLAGEPVFVLGDPAFYERLGFQSAKNPVCPYDEGNQHFCAFRWENSKEKFTVGYRKEFLMAGE